MPRGEQPLPPEGGVLTEFAAELRRLRHKAGGIPYRELSRRAHFSATTLADAAGGRRLPTLAVTLAFVRACDGDADEWEARWHETAAELAVVESELRAPDTDGIPCPYVGLAAYGALDADRFFGREQVVEDLAARVRSRRFVAVLGASGVGKSSVLHAGLQARAGQVIPGGEQSECVAFTPGPHPLQECAARIAALNSGSAAGSAPNSPPASGSAAALHRELKADPQALHLSILQALVDAPPEAEVLLVIDQFEELFTVCTSEAERTSFIAALSEATLAANSRTRVVIALRADFYAHCAQYPVLVNLLQDRQFLVGPMSPEELRRAVTRPAATVDCALESALQTRIVAEAVGQANALPLISHAMRETWRRRRGNTLTLAGYEACGGITHALAQTAEDAYRGLSPAHQEKAQRLLLRLVRLGEAAADTKQRIARADVDADTEPVLAALVDARLVTVDADGVELTHEALLRAWPRLRGWIEDDRAGLLVRQQLTDAATAWQSEGRDPDALHRGGKLTAASDWARRHPEEVRGDPVLLRFLAASVRREKRVARLRTAVIVALSVLSLLTSTMAVVAVQQRTTARTQRDHAAAGDLAATASRLRADDPSLAAQLDLASYRLHPDPQTRADLLGTQNTPLARVLAGHGDTVFAVAYSPDGRILASGSADGTIQLWNPAAEHPTSYSAPIEAGTGWVYWLAFSPDGHTLAGAGQDHTVRLWDVTDPTRPAALALPLTGHSDFVYAVAFSPDGHTLASASRDGTIRLWDVTDPARPAALGPPLTGHTGAVASLAYGPDGKVLASAGHDKTVRLWDVSNPAHPNVLGQPLTGHRDVVYSVTFSPDGRTLASASGDHTVRLWNITDPARAAPLGPPLTGHTDVVYAVAFSPDGHTLATAGADHGIRLWNVTDVGDPLPLGRPLAGHTGYVYWLAFSPDGRNLASASADHTVRVWSLPGGVLLGHTDAVNAVAFSPDHRTLASASNDRTVRLWDITDPAHPTAWGPPLTGHTDSVAALAFSPDGHTLASGGRDATIRLWKVTDPAHPTRLGPPLTGHAGTIPALAFSPNGRTLASGSRDATVRLWNVADPGHASEIGPPLTGHGDEVYSVAFSPDGHTLATAGADDRLLIFDVADPWNAHALAAPTNTNSGGVYDLAFSPDGRTLATGNQDHAVGLWDVSDPRLPQALGRLSGHTGFVYAVAFSPDGRTLVSSSDDGTVRLWDTADPRRAAAVGASVAAHTKAVDDVVFSPDGRLVASAGDDRTVEVTSVEVADAVGVVCRRTDGAVNQSQWRQFVAELPYQPPCR